MNISLTLQYNCFRILARLLEKSPKVFSFCARVQTSEQKFSYIFFFFKFLTQKTHLEFNLSPSLSLFIQFFVSFSCLCSQRKSGFWNPKCQVLLPLLHISGLTGLQLPRWLRSEIHPYKNPVSDNSWCLREGKKISRIRSVLLTCFMIPCHEAWAYILLQTAFNFLCYICVPAMYFFIILWTYPEGKQ